MGLHGLLQRHRYLYTTHVLVLSADWNAEFRFHLWNSYLSLRVANYVTFGGGGGGGSASRTSRLSQNDFGFPEVTSRLTNAVHVDNASIQVPA
jgi:hypothetical protein